MHLGVYAVGHRRPTQRGRWMAAVLAGGAGAVLSHLCAAALFRTRRGAPAEIENSASHLGRRPGIHAHRATLPPDEVTTHGTATAFERDRARDRSLQAAGWRVIRITWRQLEQEPERIAADLARLLSLPAPHESAAPLVVKA